MAAQKCKNIFFQAALKDFWSSANPKLKKIKFVKTLTPLGSYWKKKKKSKMEIHGDSWELLSFESDLKYCSTMSFQKKAELWRSVDLGKA